MTETYGNGNTHRYENGAHGTCTLCHRPSKRKICLRCRPEKKRLELVSLENLYNDISERGVNVVAQDYGLNEYQLKTSMRRRIEKIHEILGEVKEDKRSTINYPPIKELVAAIQERGYRQVSSELNVSDKELAKHVEKQLGYPLKTKYSRSGRPKKNSGENNL